MLKFIARISISWLIWLLVSIVITIVLWSCDVVTADNFLFVLLGSACLLPLLLFILLGWLGLSFIRMAAGNHPSEVGNYRKDWYW